MSGNAAVTKATIVNWALTEIGSFATFSIEDDSDLAGQIDNTWQRCVDHCFSMHDWTFCRRTSRLTRHATAPENGWQFGFDLPGDKIGDPLKLLARAGQSPEPLRNFDLEGNAVYTNVATCWARCRVAVDPQYWDPGFRSAFTVALAGFLAIPVSHDKDERDSQFTRAFGTPSKEGTGGMFGRLMAQNKAAAPIGQPLLNQDPLTAAHDTGVRDPWYGRFA